MSNLITAIVYLFVIGLLVWLGYKLVLPLVLIGSYFGAGVAGFLLWFFWCVFKGGK